MLVLKKVFLFTLIVLISFSNQIFGQGPQPHRQKAFGSIKNDWANSFVKTSDKGYALIFSSESVGGDIDSVGYNYKTFVWIVRTDSSQGILWQRKINKEIFPEFYDGINATSIFQTKDSGIIVCITSAVPYGEKLAYALKFDKFGNYLWKYGKPFANAQQEYLQVCEMDNGSLLVAGNTSEPTRSQQNIWLTMLSPEGSYLWNKLIIHPQNLPLTMKRIHVLDNKDLIIAGNYNMGSQDDVFIMRTDSVGERKWTKTYGGSNGDYITDMIVQNDGMVFSALTTSRDGDVVGVHCTGSYLSFCDPDAWIVKVDTLGNIVWKKTYGDYGPDEPRKLIPITNGYYVVGSSASNLGAFSANRGKYDVWLMELTKGGDLVNNHVFFGGPKNDWAVSATVDSAYGKIFPIILATTESESGGQVEGFHDETVAANEKEGWLFKLGYFNTVKGSVFYDLNKNGVQDIQEPAFNRGIITAKSQQEEQSFYNLSGEYLFKLEGPVYTLGYYLGDTAFVVTPSLRNLDFGGSYFGTSVNNFAVQLRPGLSDVSISSFPVSSARPGFEGHYSMMLTNRSGDIVNQKSVYFIKDSRSALINSVPAPSRISGDSLIFNYTNLKYNDTLRYYIRLSIAAPPLVQQNDTLKHLAWAPYSLDADSSDNRVLLKEIVRGSYDPNDKYETHEGLMQRENALSGEYLNYRIRFQNTGTDTAFNVVIRDSIDGQLDLSTIEVISSSHNYMVSIVNRFVEWKFPGINLPDSNVNKEKSNGYITFRIKTKKDLTAGTVIKNAALIYFDFNLPVLTNIETTEIASLITGIGNPAVDDAGELLLFPNPADETVFVRMKSKYSGTAFVKFFNGAGRQLFDRKLGIVARNQLININLPVNSLKGGIYYVVITIDGKHSIQRLVVQ